MKLTLLSPYKSLREMVDVELPDFALITGVNGSGKSQFLEAIQQGVIKCTDESIRTDEIQYFNPQLLLSMVGAPPAQNHPQSDSKWRRAEGVKQVLQAIAQSRRNFESWGKNNAIAHDGMLDDLRWLLNASRDELKGYLLLCCQNGKLISDVNANNLMRNFFFQKDHSERVVFNGASQFGEMAKHLTDYTEEEGLSVLALTEDDITRALPAMWIPSNGLAIRLSEWFVAYYLAWERNRMHRYFSEKLGENHSWVSDEEFERDYGPAPWMVTNEVFSLCGASYTFEKPAFAFGSKEDYKISIKSNYDPGAKIEMHELSTGEQLLLAVTLFLYRGNAGRGLAKLPKMLLLDEIDSPLHPGFTRPLLHLLIDTIVKKFGVRISMVTHSPTTIALAPEESVFEMRRNPRELAKVTRAQAVEALTSGFVTVLPSSRVVIVESEIDANALSIYFQSILAGNHSKSRVSLTFLSAAFKDSSGGGGVGEVKKWAPKLGELFEELGFFGLIDRDKGNSEDDVVKVLKRHSIENYIFDPLTIAAHFIKEGRLEIFKTCSITNMNYHRISEISVSEAQALLDDICVALSKGDGFENAGRVDVRYLRKDLKLSIPEWVINMEGHQLESMVKRKLNPLLASRKAQIVAPGSDSCRLALDIQKSLPDLISADFVEIFDSIQRGK